MVNQKPRCSNTNPLSQGQGDQPCCASVTNPPGQWEVALKKLEWKGMEWFQRILVLVWVTIIMILKMKTEFYWLLTLISLISHLVIWSHWWVVFLRVFKSFKIFILCIYLAMPGLSCGMLDLWYSLPPMGSLLVAGKSLLWPVGSSSLARSKTSKF